MTYKLKWPSNAEKRYNRAVKSFRATTASISKQGKVSTNSREELDKEAENLIENISDIAKTISAEMGTTIDSVLKGLGIQELNLYELGILEKPIGANEKSILRI